MPKRTITQPPFGGDIRNVTSRKRGPISDEEVRRLSEVSTGVSRDQSRTKDMVEETRNLGFGRANIRRRD